MSEELSKLMQKHPREMSEYRSFMIRVMCHMTPKQRKRALAALGSV